MADLMYGGVHLPAIHDFRLAVSALPHLNDVEELDLPLLLLQHVRFPGPISGKSPALTGRRKSLFRR